MKIAQGQMGLVDLNDAIISGTPPVNPSNGTLWIDESITPYPMLKKWDGTQWLNLGELADDYSETISDITETLGNMANDNLIDYNERQVVKDKLTQIIGYVMADATTTLPTSATLDASLKGGYYSVRKSALNAGLATNNAKYIAVKTTYDALKTYLDSLTPVKPWDLRTATKDSNITVVKSTFRDRWLQYYLAVDALATETALKLKENVDNISVGGRNLIIKRNAVNGYLVNGVLTVTTTAITTDFIAVTAGESVIYNTFKLSPTHRIEYFNASKVFVSRETVTSLDPVIRTVPAGISFVRWSPDSTTPYDGSYKIEKGTIPTNWSPAPEDIDQNFTDVYFQLESDQIVQKVTSHQTYTNTINTINTNIDLVDKRHGNLVKNPILTKDGTGWTSNASTTVVDKEFFGQTVKAIQNVDASVSNGSTVYSDYFEVDPSKMYEVTVWLQSSIIPENGGSTYLGIQALNEGGSTTDVEQISNTTGVVTSASTTNFYFWNTIDTASLEGWYKVTGYILPIGFQEMDAIGLSPNAVSSARMKPLVRRVRLRFLNYYNYEVSRTVWMTNPRVSEVSAEAPTGNKIDIISNKLNEVEQRTTAEGIETTIISSTSFQNALSSKADAEAIGDLVTKDELAQFDSTVDDKVSGAIGSIDFEPYATKLELQEQSDNITSKFYATGGMNLLKNSIGFAGMSFWDQTSPTPTATISTSELDTLGFGSGFDFKTSTDGSEITQAVNVVAGRMYTLSWYWKKIGGSGITSVKILESTGANHTEELATSYTTEGYESKYVTYTPQTDQIVVVVKSTDEATVTGLMFTIGDTPLQWSLATGEVYNTNIRMDINGIRVSQMNAQKQEVGFTNITPTEFAGYYDANLDGQFEKVFYLNGDETVSKKVRAQNEITMGSLKMIAVNSGGNKGWAIIPLVE